MGKNIPAATVSRLPIYARALLALSSRDIFVASSEMIAAESQINAAQIRKDLSHIGGLGARGLGYEVPRLLAQINEELGLNRSWNVALVGYGKLGAALAEYKGFSERSFAIKAIYDADPVKVGQTVRGITIEDASLISTSLAGKDIDIAVLATPAETAQKAANALVAGGVRSILNFAPVALELPKGISLRNVDLSIELQVLSFYHNNRTNSAAGSDRKAELLDASNAYAER